MTLAVSAAGGSTGERTLPLLIDDADWDALGGRLHELRRELEDRELARVLLALSGALDAVDDPRQARELDCLAVDVLAHDPPGVGRASTGPCPVFLLEAWHGAERVRRRSRSSTRSSRRPGPSSIPAALLLEHPDRAELARTEEWLELAEMLSRYDLAALEELGFFDRDRESPGAPDRHAHVARRPTRTCGPSPRACSPGSSAWSPISPRGRTAHARIGRLVEGLGRRRWWVPEDIAAPPSTEPATASATEFNRADVDRVLRDL